MKNQSWKLVTSGLIYAGFSLYLHWPYLANCPRSHYLFVFNCCVASLGCFLLSRRWVSSFWGSLFAGAVYGFGPFLLGLGKYHPTAGLLAAAVPWFFLPGAFLSARRHQWVGVVLSVLPFSAIFLFFQASVHYRLFAMSTQARVHPGDLVGLFAPLVMAGRGLSQVNLVGFYHVPVALLVIGFSMLLAARRIGVMVIFVIGTVLSFCGSFFDISPVIWLSLPVLCCSVVIGVGFQGLVSAGRRDQTWVLASGAVTGVLAVTALLLATKYFQIFAGLGAGYGRLFVRTAQMYLIATVTSAIVFFMARSGMRLQWLRLTMLIIAVGVDVFFSAVFIIDRV